MTMNRGKIKQLRERYPKGTRVQLISMEDPYAPVPPGTEGEVICVDDEGQLHTKWGNGSTLALIPGVDSFRVLPPQLHELMLYMPMTVDYFENGGEDVFPLLDFEAARCVDNINAALLQERLPEEAAQGLMRYYDREDSVVEKVRSLNFTAEVKDGKLWGVAVCQVTADLTEEELSRLKDYAVGQASDGFGEGFEQRGIKLPDGLEIYAHLWQDHNWDIQTEAERFGMDEPELTM